jgi:hypothetical protein
MKKVFAIALCAFVFVFSAQAQNVAKPTANNPDAAAAGAVAGVTSDSSLWKPVQAQNLLGTYTGSYNNPRFNSRTLGAKLIIDKVEGSEVQAVFIPIRARCTGNLPAKGTIEGDIIKLVVRDGEIQGCSGNKLQLQISADGKKLDGNLDDEGNIMPMHLSK